MKAFKAAACAAVAVAALLFGADTAQAGPKKGLKIGLGLGHQHHHHGLHLHGSHLHGSHLHGPFVPVHGHVWHDTSHFDYVPGGWKWNGFKWVYVPGRYVYHVDGHFDHLHH